MQQRRPARLTNLANAASPSALEKPRPGPQPIYSRDAIADAAVKLADRDGIDAVSMRRVAAEIGTRATSLYRYVRAKRELLALMVERVMGEDHIPTLTGNWRGDLHTLALSMRALITRHPWMILVPAPLGRSSLTRLNATLKVLDGHNLSTEATMTVITSLVSFTRGYTAIEMAKQGMLTKSDDDPETMPSHSDNVLAPSDDFPHFMKIVAQTTDNAATSDLEFHECLNCLLDGIELRINRATRDSERH